MEKESKVKTQPLENINWVRKNFVGRSQAVETKEKSRKPLILKAARHIIRMGFCIQNFRLRVRIKNQKVLFWNQESLDKTKENPIPATETICVRKPKIAKVNNSIKLQILTKWID